MKKVKAHLEPGHLLSETTSVASFFANEVADALAKEGAKAARLPPDVREGIQKVCQL